MKTMFILENVPLSVHSTMRLGGNARFATEINSRQDISEAVSWANERSLPIITVGSGSNIIWSDDGFNGLVLINKFSGVEIFEEDAENIYVSAGAGEIWDDVVEQAVKRGLSGIEQLSLIPGTVGATPVQNVGAYGCEIKDVLTTIEAYDLQTHNFVTIPASDCDFGYRTSRFKKEDKGRFVITKVTLHLTKTPLSPPFYSSLESYLQSHNITNYSPQNIRDAVIAIRTTKLPDPRNIANVGSFFHNPIIDSNKAFKIIDKYADIPHWRQQDGKVKFSAAWLIEQAGFKDYHDAETGMATWHSQPLVLVNENAHSTEQLMSFKERIVEAVQKKFGLTLKQEPELIGD